MKPSKTPSLPLLLLVALLLSPLLVRGQNPKQELNDQLFEATRKGDATSEDGDVFVVKAGPKYELLATNRVGEVMMASPAISGGLLIVRALNHVFAFGEAAAAKEKVGN